MNEFIKLYAKWWKPDQIKIIIWFPLYKILERAKVIYGDSNVSVVVDGQMKGSDDSKGHKESFMSDEMLYALIVVVTKYIYLFKFIEIYS